VTAAVPLGGRVGAGLVVLVDDADADLVAGYAWHAKAPVSPAGRVFGPYPATTLPRPPPGGRGTRPATLMLTQLLTGWPRTLHLNGDPLDCRRANLAPAPRRKPRTPPARQAAA
jgi:hypothetical protein